MCLSTPSVPDVPKPPAQATESDPAVLEALRRQRAARAAAQGLSANILAGAKGQAPAAAPGAQILGQ